MGSSSEYAAGPGSPAASEDAGGDEPEASGPEASGPEASGPEASGSAGESDGPGRQSDELRRQSAAMLQTLADRYDAESEDSRARSAQLLAESEAAGALAVKFAEESVRIRTEADRLAAEPTWLKDVPDTTAGPKQDADAASDEVAGAEAATTAQASASISTSTTGTPAPGPGPARGFAHNVGSTEGSQSGGSGSQASSASESDDWSPRPFESWRNQASQVTPRVFEL